MKRIRALLLAVAAFSLPIAVLGVMTSTASATTPTCSTSTSNGTCTQSATATIAAGTLGLEAPATAAWSATLGPTDQVIGLPETVSAVDETGSGAGWNLTVSSTDFADTGGTTYCTSAAPCDLPTSGLVINGSSSSATATTAPSTTCQSGATCTLPSSTTDPVTYPLTVPEGSSPTAVAFSTANAATGMGPINLATDWWLSVPANSYAGTYTATITLAAVSGP